MKRAFLSLLLAGCATTTDGAPAKSDDARFPSRDKLNEVATALDQAKIKSGSLDPERFTLKGALPDVSGQRPSVANTAMDRLVNAALPEKSARTEGLDCAARQFAALLNGTGKLPGQNFQRFVLARCGAMPASVGLSTLSGTADKRMSDDELIAAWSEQLEQLAANLGTTKQSLGFALSREGEKVAIVGVHGASRFELEAPISQAPDEGAMLIKGRLTSPAEEVRATVTHGRFKAVECTPAPVALPAFQLLCPLEKGDALATVQVGARRRGRLLGDVLGRFMARPDKSEAREFSIPRRGSPLPATDASGVQRAFVERLNDVRKEAGMTELVADSGQNKMVGKLARPFLAAIAEGREDVMDAITLGTMAGWDVEGVLESGGFAWSFLAPTSDVSALLAFALESPSARLALLDPEADRVAVGGLVEEGAMAAIVGVYRTFEDTEFEDAADAVWQQLVKATAARGHPAPTRFEAARVDVLEAARGLESGALDTDSALKQLTERAKTKSKRGVRALVFSVNKPDAIDFPPELLVPGLELDLSIGHMAPREGEAWGRYVVFVIINVTDTVTARASLGR